MKTKRSQEGYLLIDHRAGGGLGPNDPGIPVPAHATFESATLTCSHCQRVVVLRPDRTRSRGYCPKCDHYICDSCEAARVANGGLCRTFNQIIEEAQEAAVRGRFICDPIPAPSSNLII